MHHLAASEALVEGQALTFRVRLPVGEPGALGEQGAFAIRHRGEVRAYLNVCTHRALPLDLLRRGEFFAEDGGSLVCQAHGARFHPVDGSCVGGICTRGSHLSPLAVEERDGGIFLSEAEPVGV